MKKILPFLFRCISKVKGIAGNFLKLGTFFPCDTTAHIFRGTSEIINGNDHAVLIDCKISCKIIRFFIIFCFHCDISAVTVIRELYGIVFLGDHRDCLDTTLVTSLNLDHFLIICKEDHVLHSRVTAEELDFKGNIIFRYDINGCILTFV